MLYTYTYALSLNMPCNHSTLISLVVFADQAQVFCSTKIFFLQTLLKIVTVLQQLKRRAEVSTANNLHYLWIQTYTCTCTNTPIHTCIDAHTYTHINTYLHTHLYTHKHTHTSTHTHTHTHTYEQTHIVH